MSKNDEKMITYKNVIGAIGKSRHAWGVIKQVQEYVEKKITYTYKVSETSDLFKYLSIWINENNVERANIRQFEATLDYREERETIFQTKPLDRQWIEINGHKVFVQYHDGSKSEMSEDSYGGNSFIKIGTITLGSYTKDGSKAIEDLLIELGNQRDEFRSVYTYSTRYSGSWNKSRVRLTRTFEYLMLSKDAETTIKKDIETFRQNEEKYTKLALPYKRNYLFWGPPGTGKTSVAQAIANYLDVDLYILDPSSMKDGTELSAALTDVPEGAILLIEDLDVSGIQVDRENDTTKSINLSSVLNALDGVTSAKGIITILTTNNPEALDEALVRSGRMDLKLHLDYLTNEEVETLIGKITGKKVSFKFKEKVCPADIMEIVKRNITDDNKIIKEVKNYAKDPKAFTRIEEFKSENRSESNDERVQAMA